MVKNEAAEAEKKRKKAEKKAEKLRQAEELRIKQRKDDLELELELEKFNKKLTKVKFDEVALKRNFPLITDNMKYAKATFEKVLDSKNTLIQFLLERLKHAHLQREFAHQYQLEVVDQILCMYDSELKTLHKHYIQDRGGILKKRLCIAARATNRLNKKDDTIKAILFHMEEQHKDAMEELKGNNLRILDETVKEQKMEYLDICTKYEGTLAKLWKMYRTVFNTYKLSTMSMKEKYIELKLKDSEDDLMIKTLAEKINKLQNFIEKNGIKKNNEEVSSPRYEKVKDLQMEKEKFLTAYNKLRIDMKAEGKIDSEKLLFLAKLSHNIIERLKKLKSKIETSLKLIMMCSKYETEEEKVLPFPSRTLSIGFLPENDEHLNDLEKLWYRHTHITVQNRYLKHIIDQLKDDECDLKERLKYALMEIGEVPADQL